MGRNLLFGPIKSLTVFPRLNSALGLMTGKAIQVSDSALTMAHLIKLTSVSSSSLAMT